MFDSLDRMRGALGARHHVHLRFETHHVSGVDTAQQWIRAGRVQFLALNDHLPSMARRLGDDRKLLQYADRAECDLDTRSEEHTSELQSLMRISYAVFCLKKKNIYNTKVPQHHTLIILT